MTFNGVTSLNVYWLRIHMLQKLKHVPSQFQVQAQIKKKKHLVAIMEKLY